MSDEKKLIDFWSPHDPVKLDTGDKTIVEQHHEETTNINKIIGRYRRGAPLPINENANYTDVSEVGELMDIKLMMSDMQQNYENLPDFIKDKLPLADISSVTDESLQALFDEQFKQQNVQSNNSPAPGEAGETKKPDKGAESE